MFEIFLSVTIIYGFSRIVTFEFCDSDGNAASQTYYVPYGKTLAEAGYTAPSVTTYEKEEKI